ncbi:hypothetical protein CDO52_02275 [Nocardiopsis gilva YIM 90087]|uniref:Transposase DDE domain-containing protein n=1 Tax=Nocardiopsis gilva YIM 90087 TaxID=1235441 RepID=A0A223S0X2_9ACTN|nr:hypothetical protein CDO52_02275 [Nocardiopsis gilva YIM 90087]
MHQLPRGVPQRGFPQGPARPAEVQARRAGQPLPPPDLRGQVRHREHVNEFAHGHEMRRCRYRGLEKTHVQHVLTAIAVNVERLCDQLPPEAPCPPRPPTAFQTYLDQQGTPRPRSWRFVGG